MGSKKMIVGYHYELAWHDGLNLGDMDAYLALEAGTKIAWEGEVTENTLININEPELWGGEKDQGGVVGGLRVMFGKADQMPNEYLTGVFGNQTVAWRGIATVAFEGGRWSANNPYQMKRAHKVRRILKGWDDDDCWYPEKAAVPLVLADVPDGTGGGPDVPTDFGSNIGRRVVLVSGSGSCTLELAEAAGLGYTLTDEAFWFWRENESGLGFVKLHGESDSVAALSLIEDGWQIDETALFKLNSGALVAVVLTTTTSPPYAPPGRSWTPSNVSENPALPPSPITSSLGVAYLWYTSVYAIGLNQPSVPGGGEQARYAKNPAHMILYAHTQAHAGGQPRSGVNLTSLTTAADWFYDQGFGLCTARRPDKESPAEFIRRIERVAGCSFSQSNEDGLYYLDIANGVYDLESLPILTDDDVITFEDIPATLDNAVNSVSVKYFDPKRKESITTRPLQALGLVADFGENHQTFDFPEIPTDSIAGRVRMREILAFDTPTRAFNLVTTPKTRTWRKNTYFRAQLPKRGIADMVCLVAEGDDGTLTSGNCQFKATQDIYSLPTTAYASTEMGVDTRAPQTPVAITAGRVFEAPYIEAVAAISPADFAVLAADAGFVIGVAANPGDMLDFTMAIDAGAGYEDKASGDYCPTALTTATILPGQTTGIPYTAGMRMPRVEIGSMVLLNDELCRIDAIDLVASTLDLGRGCADTVPQKHAAGSRLYFYTDQAAADTTEYTDGETIGVKLRSNTGSKRLALGAAVEIPLTLDRRIDRPYAPGDLRITDDTTTSASYPANCAGELTPEWVHRDRLLQADQRIDASAASIGPEAGTTYTVRYYLNDALDQTESGVTGEAATPYTMSGNGLARIEVEAVRDSITSWQAATAEFNYTTSPLDTYVDEVGDIYDDEVGDIYGG